MTNDVVIRADSLGKRYRLGVQGKQHNSLRDALASAVRGLTLPAQKPKGEFWALRNASFEIKRGENVGVIGLNGAGKSTLLRAIASIYPHARGRRKVRGSVCSLPGDRLHSSRKLSVCAGRGTCWQPANGSTQGRRSPGAWRTRWYRMTGSWNVAERSAT